jgi:benzil reductase ((S)-benzoin forming)
MKIAVITGVSSGIGKAITEILLNEGWKVYGLSRSKPDISNKNLIWVEADLAMPGEVKNVVGLIVEQRIDVLVSNAGIIFEELATQTSQASYEKMFNLNVLAPMLLVSSLGQKINRATIISVSSVSDRLIEKEHALYCSSKAANTRYFEAVADELRDAKVINLLPDYVDTPMLRASVGDNEFDWEGTIKVEDLAKFAVDIIRHKTQLVSSSNVIIVTNSLLEDLKSREKLYGYNTETGELSKI